MMVTSPVHKVERIKTHRELWGKMPHVGYEWDAGTFHVTALHPSGRITVKLTNNGWQVWKITWPLNRPKQEQLLYIFDSGEEGEREAKKYAREIFEKCRG